MLFRKMNKWQMINDEKACAVAPLGRALVRLLAVSSEKKKKKRHTTERPTGCHSCYSVSALLLPHAQLFASVGFVTRALAAAADLFGAAVHAVAAHTT